MLPTLGLGSTTIRWRWGVSTASTTQQPRDRGQRLSPSAAWMALSLKADVSPQGKWKMATVCYLSSVYEPDFCLLWNSSDQCLSFPKQEISSFFCSQASLCLPLLFVLGDFPWFFFPVSPFSFTLLHFVSICKVRLALKSVEDAGLTAWETQLLGLDGVQQVGLP